MGFLSRIKQAFGHDMEYDDPQSSMELIKIQEIAQPTHWIYKKVVDPIEMNYRNSALRKSLIGDYDQVVNICMKGLKKYPKSPYLYYMLGRTLGDIGEISTDNQKFNEGIIVLNHVIDLYPDFADACVERGRIQIYLSNQDEAIRDFLHAREIEPGIDLPIKFDLKMFSMELKRREMRRRFDGLGIVNNYYSSGLPIETNTLSKQGVDIVLEFLRKCNLEYVLYGSFSLMAGVLPALKRMPGDIDIQLWSGRYEAEIFSRDLFYLLKNAGEDVRLSPENIVIIESRKSGRWERAVDIHHTEEAPEDNLSPLYQLNSTNVEVGKREEEKLLIDFLDVFRIMKTSIELAKQNNLEASKINEAEGLLIELKNMYSEFIDFEKLEIKY